MASNAAKALNKLRIVNIPWTVGDHQLKQYFSQFGHIAKAKVVFDKRTGLSKNIGYLEIPDNETYHSILNKPNHHLEGFDLHIKHYWESNDQ
ncbi:SRA stem-loop-interacting RNA-binding protein, mitochondrial-like [Fopius arisanus]|uniref:SRA stem-loop-interacting RNA-binding protein, mitochondrial-like n=1 Tax=Fopius arisanus TaxID=64838 RepID=A0A9R1T0W9_9HYME|nr:PREDICTED: SRA stem-loop-interacting RNA-binding protein, mitochondrial-like [Fopius arisanus]